MTTLSDLLTRARSDTVVDTGSSQRYSDAELTRWLNEGISELFPHCWVAATDATTAVTGSTTVTGGLYVHKRYTLPAAVPTYPSLECVRRIDQGPVGGYNVAHTENLSDTWLPLRRTWPRSEPAWTIDWGARELAVAPRQPLWYDSSDTWRYYLRFYYLRPPGALASASDVLEAPDSIIPFLLQTVRLRAIQWRQPRRVTDAEQSGTLGSLAKSAEEERELLHRRLVRNTMPVPKLVR